MAHYTGGVSSVCPFYDHEARLSITCEGMSGPEGPQEAAGIRKFNSEEHKRLWQEGYCFSMQYLRCPYARLLESKYA